MKHVLLVDDLAIVRLGTTHLLKQYFPGAEVSTAEDVNEMITHLDKTKFDLLILDISFPGGNNSGMLDIIKMRQPHVKILIYSGHNEKIFVPRYFNAGAHGFLSKSESGKKLEKAITTILQGEIYISEDLKNFRIE